MNQVQLFDVGGPVRTGRSNGRRAAATSQKWTPAEDAILGTEIDRVIAQRLGRTLKSVEQRRHHLGIPLKCKQPDCTNPRRTGVQAARYCEEHATSVGYVTPKTTPIPVTCPCGNTFTVRRNRQYADGAAAAVWFEFCQHCRDKCRVNLDQLQNHKVPADLARHWIAAGEDLRCNVCQHLISSKGRGNIDHDHRHCDGATSCGQCVRGILCTRCNIGVGHIERVIKLGLYERISVYLQNRNGNSNGKTPQPFWGEG